jgi:hypothetical protein
MNLHIADYGVIYLLYWISIYSTSKGQGMQKLKKKKTLESFIYPTDAQLDCSKKMLKFTLKFT